MEMQILFIVRNTSTYWNVLISVLNWLNKAKSRLSVVHIQMHSHPRAQTPSRATLQVTWHRSVNNTRE
jgi:hypothetical protein